MKIKNCSYIELGELANLGSNAREALNAFYQYDNHEISWGDANRTMVDIPTFIDILWKAVEAADLLDPTGGHLGIFTIEKALEPHRLSTYIDFEN